MKRIRAINILVVMAMLLLSVSTVSAAPTVGPTGSWVTGITCQNLNSTTQALVTFQFYQEGQSTPKLSYPDTIPAGGTLKYFTPNTPVGLPAPFSGSLTVSSDQPVTCNANLQSTGTGTLAAPFRIGTASALDSTQAGATMYVPQVTKHTASADFNSYIAVQNAGSAADTFTVHYYDKSTGAEVPNSSETYTIDPNSSKVVYPESNANLPASWSGSAVITGTQPKAVIGTIYNTGATNLTSQFLVYDAFASGSTTLIIPRIVRRYHGYNSGITIQNIDTKDTTVTINFKFRDGSTYVYHSPTIHAKASLQLYAPNVAALNPVDALAMPNRTGAGTVISDNGAKLVGIVNSDNRGSAADNDNQAVPQTDIGKGATSNMGVLGQETFKVFFSQVTKASSGGVFTGGVIIANSTATAGTCVFTYTGVPAATQNGVVLPASGLISIYLGNVPNLPDGFNASVTATCTQKVFGVSNFSAVAAGKYGDSYTENNGYNQ